MGPLDLSIGSNQTWGFANLIDNNIKSDIHSSEDLAIPKPTAPQQSTSQPENPQAPSPQSLISQQPITPQQATHYKSPRHSQLQYGTPRQQTPRKANFTKHPATPNNPYTPNGTSKAGEWPEASPTSNFLSMKRAHETGFEGSNKRFQSNGFQSNGMDMTMLGKQEEESFSLSGEDFRDRKSVV